MTPLFRFRTGSAPLLEIGGKDREAFLQGQCTNDVVGLAENGVMRAAVLTPKGKLLADFRVARRHKLNVLTGVGGAGALVAHLRKYAVFQQVEIDPRDGHSLVELFGSSAETPQGRPGTVFDAEFAGAPVAVWPPFFEQSAAWVVPTESLPIVERALSKAGARISEEDADALRIEAGRPEYGKDMDDTHLPDEIGMDDAISTTKGCYVGQEIVARLRTYGRVNKRLVGFSFSPGFLPVPGSVLVRAGQGDKELGRVTSSAVSPRLGPIGLGFAFRDVEEGEELRFREDESQTARVTPKTRS